MTAKENNELMKSLGFASYSSVQDKLRELDEFVECGTKPTEGRPAKLYKLRDEDIPVYMKDERLESDSDFLESFLDVKMEWYSIDLEDIDVPGTDAGVRDLVNTDVMDLSHLEGKELPRVIGGTEQLEVRFYEKDGVYGHHTINPVEHSGGDYGYTYFIWDFVFLLSDFSMVKIGKSCKKSAGDRFNELISRGGWRLLPLFAFPSSQFDEDSMHLRFDGSSSDPNDRREACGLPFSENLEGDGEWFEYTSEIHNLLKREYNRHKRLRRAWSLIQNFKEREMRANVEGELSFEDSTTPEEITFL